MIALSCAPPPSVCPMNGEPRAQGPALSPEDRNPTPPHCSLSITLIPEEDNQAHQIPWEAFNCTVSKQQVTTGLNKKVVSALSGSREQKEVLQASPCLPLELHLHYCSEALVKCSTVKRKKKGRKFPLDCTLLSWKRESPQQASTPKWFCTHSPATSSHPKTAETP